MPDETGSLERVTFNRRFFGDSLLEAVLMVVTLFVGWYIWLAFTAQTAQTPAKRLLNVYTVDVNTGQPVSTGRVWLRDVLIKQVLLGWVGGSFLFGLPGLVDAIWVLFDKDRQALHDKVVSTVVVYAPAGLPEGLKPPMPMAGPARKESVTDVGEQLRELARLREEGILTDEEYDEKRKELADRL
jgi:uncharacterized RDD family membrane protein YckC